MESIVEGALIGRWVVIRAIAVGQGAFGDVLEVEDTHGIHGRAALKLYKREIDVHDVRNLARVRHPRIIGYLDDGTVESGTLMGRAFLVMELASATLSSVLPSEVGQIAVATASVLAALDHVHHERLVHRDVKPANILFAGSLWKLGDFGLSRTLDATGYYHGVLAGTLPYLAPEVVTARGTVKEAIDIFAAGATAHAALGYGYVWDDAQIGRLSTGRDPGQPRVANEVPRPWRTFVEACLAPADDRPTAAEARALVPSPSTTGPGLSNQSPPDTAHTGRRFAPLEEVASPSPPPTYVASRTPVSQEDTSLRVPAPDERADGKPPPPILTGMEFVETLGGGGFATVYRYWQQFEARDVAVKVLDGKGFDPARLRKLEAESKTMARVSNHPRIAKIFSANVTSDGHPYIVMQYYPQRHYGLRANAAPLTEEEVLRVGVQIASAVEVAHRAGIVHRDIKPGNILLDNYGPVLTDFGISTFDADPNAPFDDVLTVAYAAPELLRNAAAAPSVLTDVYALSATLWALLCGRPPFHGGSDVELMNRILTSPIPDLPRRDISVAFEQVLRRGLNPEPGERPQTARELGEALQDVQRQAGLSPTSLELGVMVDSEKEASDGRAVDPSTQSRPRRNGSVRPPVIGSLSSIHPGSPGDSRGSRAGTAIPLPAPPPEPASVTEEVSTSSEPVDRDAERRGGRGRLVAGVVVLMIVALIGVISLYSKNHGSVSTRGAVPTTFDPGDPERIPSITNIQAQRTQPTTVVISWSLPDPQPGDVVSVQRVDLGHEGIAQEGVTSPVTVTVAAGGAPCFEVWAAATNHRLSPMVRVCP